jgi:hypothetical protein
MAGIQDDGAPDHKGVASDGEAGAVSISGSQGVQAGSGNTQVNNFFFFGQPASASGPPPDFVLLPESVKPNTQDSSTRMARGGEVKEDTWPAFSRVPLALTGLPELGSVTAEVPSWYENPVHSPDSLTATAVQLALLTALGIGPEPRTDQTVTVQDHVPDPFGLASDGSEAGTGVSLSAADGPAAVMELLATSAVLGGVPVSAEDSESAALRVLAGAGDWWHSPSIVLDYWSPFGDGTRRTVARCSAAGWADADSGESGFVILVDAIGADSDGVVGAGASDLHRFMLWWELPRVSEGDAVAWDQLELAAGTLRRLVLHCPGEDRCPSDGCLPADALDIDLLVARIVGQSAAVASMLAGGDWAANAYLRTLVDADDPGVWEEPGTIIWIVENALGKYGWQPASLGHWDTGDVDRLLYRDGQVVLVRHHLALRALSVLDGMEELEFLRDAANEDDASVAGASEQPGVGTAGLDDVGESDAFQECLERLEAGTMKPVAGLGLHLTPLFMLWPWGDGQPHSQQSREETTAWIEAWVQHLPGIA